MKLLYYRKVKRNLLSFLCFYTALFVFQACNETKEENGNEILIEGLVLSSANQEPIQGIKASIDNTQQYIYSDEDGKFNLWTEKDSEYVVRFQDIDYKENGLYLDQDTVINSNDNLVYLEIMMIER